MLGSSIHYEVFKMLKAEAKITDAVIENMMNRHRSGFNVYCGKAIWPHNEQGLENLARYIIRAFFSRERMTYIATDQSADGVAKVIYQSIEITYFLNSKIPALRIRKPAVEAQPKCRRRRYSNPAGPYQQY
jgi:hypothetical protein